MLMFDIASCDAHRSVCMRVKQRDYFLARRANRSPPTEAVARHAVSLAMIAIVEAAGIAKDNE